MDYDLKYCLEYNPQPGFGPDDIDQVLAVVEGQHDETPWHWLLHLKSGRVVYLTGGCDYTGWDCQSWAESEWFDSVSAFVYQGRQLSEKASAFIQLGDRAINGAPVETTRERVGRELFSQ